MSNVTNTETGRRIAHLRERRGLSQSELARQSDVRREAINRYEKGGVMPDVPTLVKIAKALDTTVDSLV